MINTFRDNLKRLKWVIWAVIAAFVVTIFAVWGGGTNRGEAIAANWAARVNDDEITVIEFQNAYRISELNYREVIQRTQEFNPAAMGLGYEIMRDLVHERLLAQEARRLGFRVTDEEVAETIVNDPNFQESGRFIGRDEYVGRLSAVGLSAALWERQMYWRLLAGKTMRILETLPVITDEEIEMRFHDTERRASLLYFTVPEAKLPKNITVPESGLREFYEANLSRYEVPEERRVEYVVFDPKDHRSAVKVTEEDLREYYERAKEFYFVGKEQWSAGHILVATNAAMSEIEKEEKLILAESIADRVKKGEDFAKLAREYSDDPGSKAQGGDLGTFGPGAMVTPFEQAVRALKPGEVSGVVETQFGYHVIKLNSAEPGGYYKPFEQVRGEIETQFRAQRSNDAARERAAQLAKDAAAGTLRQTAEAMGLKVQVSPFFARGDASAFPPEWSRVATLAWSMDVRDVSDVVTAGDKHLVVSLADRRERRTPPLAEIREKVMKDARDERRAKVYVDWAKPMVERLKAGKVVLRAMAKEHGLDLSSTGTFTRTNRPVQFNERALGLFELVESMAEKEFGAYYHSEKGLMVFEVDVKLYFDEGAIEERKTYLRGEILRARHRELMGAMVARLRERARVEVNEDLIKAAQRGETPRPPSI